MARTVSPAAGTGAAGPRGAWQRTSASRTSGSSRQRMVPAGSPGSTRRGRAQSALSARWRQRAPDLGGAPPPPRAPTLYGSPGGGAGGSAGADPSALTSPYSEPGRRDSRRRKPSVSPPNDGKAECTASLSLSPWSRPPSPRRINASRPRRRRPPLLRDRAPTLTRARAFRASRGPVLQREEAPRGLTPGAEG